MRYFSVFSSELAYSLLIGLVLINFTLWAINYDVELFIAIFGLTSVFLGFYYSILIAMHINGFKEKANRLAGLSIMTLGILMMIVGFGGLYVFLEVQDDKHKVDMYGGLYFSIVTWTTLGYGDITPIGTARLAASIEALLGYIMMASLAVRLIHYFDFHTPQKQRENSNDKC